MTSTNPSFKPSEGKREEFRKYLEKTGVMDALTKTLVNLHEEVDKPDDALEYIRDRLATIAGLETYRQLQNRVNEAEERIRELEAQLQGEGKTEVPEEGAAAAELEEQAPAEVEETPKAEDTDLIPEENPEETPQD
ncbi:unnamed protein product [Ceutorhynchus assimilis]|uniref:c-Myc-binding protein n=1 Tax=Ceutorhynchus assimilis TaxID=467358 RepID=A0A9N9MTE8_9CUCU|nr:unnamed protein product [Ceutorhynchus assimilis]